MASNAAVGSLSPRRGDGGGGGGPPGDDEQPEEPPPRRQRSRRRRSNRRLLGRFWGEGLWSAGPPPSVKPGTMVCVASAVKAGFEFEVHVGEVDDEFVVTLSQNNARQGETYTQQNGLIRMAPHS